VRIVSKTFEEVYWLHTVDISMAYREGCYYSIATENTIVMQQFRCKRLAVTVIKNVSVADKM